MNSNVTGDVQFYINNVGFGFISTLVCVIGVFLHVITLTVLYRLQGTLYRYIQVKTATELVILALGVAHSIRHLTVCDKCNQIFGSYLMRTLEKYAERYLLHSAHTFVGVCELLIAYDRLMAFHAKSKPNFFSANNKLNLCISLLFSLSLFVPFTFSAYVDLASDEGNFRLAPTQFGRSKGFRIFMLVQVSLKHIVMFSLLILLTVLLVRKHNHHIVRHNRYVSPQKLNESVETPCLSSSALSDNSTIRRNSSHMNNRSVAKMLIILNSSIITSRSLMISDCLIALFDVAVLPTFRVCLGFAASLSVFLVYTVNFFIYLFFNKIFANRFKHMFLFQVE